MTKQETENLKHWVNYYLSKGLDYIDISEKLEISTYDIPQYVSNENFNSVLIRKQKPIHTHLIYQDGKWYEDITDLILDTPKFIYSERGALNETNVFNR